MKANCKIPSSSGHNIMNALRQLTEVTLVVFVERVFFLSGNYEKSGVGAVVRGGGDGG